MSADMLGTSTLADVAKLLKTFSERLAGNDGEEWITAFKRFLRKENPWPTQQPALTAIQIKIWRKITIGNTRRHHMLHALHAHRMKVSEVAAKLVEQTCFSDEVYDIYLVTLTVAELGFPDGGTLQQILARGKAYGLEPCDPTVGPHLRMVYHDQPRRETICMAMQPIAIPGETCPRIFAISRQEAETVELDAYLAPLPPKTGCFDPEIKFAFMLPRAAV